MDMRVSTALLKWIRDDAGVRQADLAKTLGISTSVLSRVEGSEFADPNMAKRYLEALATPLAAEVLGFFSREWHHLDRPDFRHPDKAIMWDADQALMRLAAFSNSDDFDPILQNPLNGLRNRIVAEVEYVRRTDHGIAFVGEIGVGKTTALSFVTNLVVGDGGEQQSVFPTGSGRTTVCEVAIRIAPAYGIAVDALSEDEVRLLVSNLVGGVRSGKGGLPSELERVIRNMADVRRFTVRGRKSGEKPVTVDRLRELIDTLDDDDAVIAEIVARMGLADRTGTQMILSADEDSMEWLSSNIAKINYGQHPDFSVPQRITVLLPLDALRSTPYALSVIDTKGVEGTTQRADLMRQLEDERTLCVLCCSFADAPGNVPLSMMRDAIDAGTDAIASDRVCLLVLPRNDEALKVVDDTGQRPDSSDEGYAIREAQIDQQFGTDGLPQIAVNFFQVGADPAQGVWEWLIDRVSAIRSEKIARIGRHVAAVDNLIGNADIAKTREARTAIALAMDRALVRFDALPPIMRPASSNLVAEVKKTHQSSVAASVNRNGDWQPFPVAYILGQGVRRDVNLRSRDILVRIDETIQGLMDDYGHLADVAQFLESLQEDIAGHRRELLSRVALAGRMLFAPHLVGQASALWTACRRRYGAGSGYRVDVSEEFERHFEQNVDAQATVVRVEQQIEKLWTQIVIEPLREASAFNGE